MGGSMLLTLTIGFGAVVVVAGCPSAQAAGQASEGLAVTGSMFNGNNARPPDLAAHEPHIAAAANQTGAETRVPACDNRGGNSDTSRAGGGG